MFHSCHEISIQFPLSRFSIQSLQFLFGINLDSKTLCGKNYDTIITFTCCVSWFAGVHRELMINPGTPTECVCSTVVSYYHNACGGLP